jgi:hypothetical protein
LAGPGGQAGGAGAGGLGGVAPCAGADAENEANIDGGRLYFGGPGGEDHSGGGGGGDGLYGGGGGANGCAQGDEVGASGGGGSGSSFGPPGTLFTAAQAAAPSVTITPLARARVAATPVTPTVEHFRVSNFNARPNGSLSLWVKVPASGVVDLLETAWDDNIKGAAVTAQVLQPAPFRFVFARAHAVAHGGATLRLRVTPSTRGKYLVRHPAYRITLRLWITYTRAGEKPLRVGLSNVHLGPKSGLPRSITVTTSH